MVDNLKLMHNVLAWNIWPQSKMPQALLLCGLQLGIGLALRRGVKPVRAERIASPVA